MGGELHYLTNAAGPCPRVRALLDSVRPSAPARAHAKEILREWHAGGGRALPPITEDTMPGELANIIAGRVANLLNLRGPNFITDAACASSAWRPSSAAIEAGGAAATTRSSPAASTATWAPSTFVKFCKIGALSPPARGPFADGADGFVMGEGAARFLLKRLADAERDGDRIYAVIRGVGGSSDGKGKGITAPNPRAEAGGRARLGERRARPGHRGLLEAHGTSTRVGDVAESRASRDVRRPTARPAGRSRWARSRATSATSRPRGRGRAAQGRLALHHKVLPPTLNAEARTPTSTSASTRST
jgi:acyl transferase domain-containing protein